jgi:hypothetical protein
MTRASRPCTLGAGEHATGAVSPLLKTDREGKEHSPAANPAA